MRRTRTALTPFSPPPNAGGLRRPSTRPILPIVKVLDWLDSTELPLPRSVLTIGNFDGVHRGHQEIMAVARRLARAESALLVVLTFQPHPLSVIAPSKAPPCLTPPDEKLRCLAEAGADIVVVAAATRALLALSPEEFVARAAEQLKPCRVVEGRTFGFGRGRSGTVGTLARLAAQHGFEVTVVPPVKVDLESGQATEVSSSLIRRLVASGQVQQAAIALGRRYAVIGPVVHGARRGGKTGFPTANLSVTDHLVPGDGVYAGVACQQASGQAGAAAPMPAAISIGTAPTFHSDIEPAERKIEAYLIDVDADLYGQRLRLEFGRRLRPQRGFDSAEALAAQVSHDVEAVRQFAAAHGSEARPMTESS